VYDVQLLCRPITVLLTHRRPIAFLIRPISLIVNRSCFITFLPFGSLNVYLVKSIVTSF